MHNYKESTYKKVVETLAIEGGHAIFQIFENDDCVVTCGNDECMGLTTVPFRTLYRNYTLKNGVFSCPHCKRRNYLQAWADKHNALLSPDNHTVKCRTCLMGHTIEYDTINARTKFGCEYCKGTAKGLFMKMMYDKYEAGFTFLPRSVLGLGTKYRIYIDDSKHTSNINSRDVMFDGNIIRIPSKLLMQEAALESICYQVACLLTAVIEDTYTTFSPKGKNLYENVDFGTKDFENVEIEFLRKNKNLHQVF